MDKTVIEDENCTRFLSLLPSTDDFSKETNTNSLFPPRPNEFFGHETFSSASCNTEYPIPPSLDKTDFMLNLREHYRMLEDRVNEQQMQALCSTSNGDRVFGECYGCAEKEAQIQKLTATLGKTEYENDGMHECYLKMKEEYHLQKQKDNEQIEQLKCQLVSYASKLQEMINKNRSLSKENEKFLAYKATLPTKQEHETVKHNLELVNNKNEMLKEKLSSVLNEKTKLRAVVKANQKEITERNTEIEQFKSKLEKSEENIRILEDCLRSDGSSESELPHVTIANLKREVSELSNELAKCKKLAKSQRSALKIEASKNEQTTKELNDRVSECESEKEQLSSELKELRLEFKIVKTSLEEISQENIFLKQEKESVEEEIQQLKNLQLCEKYKTNKIVNKQLEECHKQLRELFSIFKKLRSGSGEVDISVIIGCNESGDRDHTVYSHCEDNKQQPITTRVSELQKELSLFRQEINDEAASAVGSDCHVQ